MFFPSSFLSPGLSLPPPRRAVWVHLCMGSKAGFEITGMSHVGIMRRRCPRVSGSRSGSARSNVSCAWRAVGFCGAKICAARSSIVVSNFCVWVSPPLQKTTHRLINLLSSGVEAILACALMLQECWHAHGDSVSMLILTVWHVTAYYQQPFPSCAAPSRGRQTRWRSQMFPKITWLLCIYSFSDVLTSPQTQRII